MQIYRCKPPREPARAPGLAGAAACICKLRAITQQHGCILWAAQASPHTLQEAAGSDDEDYRPVIRPGGAPDEDSSEEEDEDDEDEEEEDSDDEGQEVELEVDAEQVSCQPASGRRLRQCMSTATGCTHQTAAQLSRTLSSDSSCQGC